MSIYRLTSLATVKRDGKWLLAALHNAVPLH
jgi:hypothetical protein